MTAQFRSSCHSEGRWPEESLFLLQVSREILRLAGRAAHKAGAEEKRGHFAQNDARIISVYFFEICVAPLGCKISFCTRQFNNSPT